MAHLFCSCNIIPRLLYFPKSTGYLASVRRCAQVDCQDLYRKPSIAEFEGTNKAVYAGRHLVTMLPGYGVGPELMDYVKQVFKCGGFPVDFEVLQFSENEHHEVTMQNVVASIKRNGVCLKGKIEPPTDEWGSDMPMSHQVTIRNSLDLYVNVVEFKSYPGVCSKHQDIDLVVVRMNTEGEYNMLEHQNVKGVTESLRVVTRNNSKRVAQFCFEYAKKYGRKKVTAVHHYRLMHLSDGLFLKTARQVKECYPEIEYDEMDLKDCILSIIKNPECFDVLLMPNLYGSIMTHVICGLMRGVGLVSGKNFGDEAAVFEASARHAGWDLAGKNVANPVSMLNAAVDMLEHLGLYYHSYVLHRAIDKTINEDKIHTKDLGGTATSVDVVENILKHVHKTMGHVNWPAPKSIEEVKNFIMQLENEDTCCS